MYVSFHFGVFYCRNLRYTCWHSKARMVLICLVLWSVQLFFTHVSRGNYWFRKSQFIFTYFTFGIYDFITDSFTSWRCFFVWFYDLCSFGLHLFRRRNNWLCESHLILTYLIFVICRTVTDIGTLGGCLFVWCFGLCSFALHMFIRRYMWLIESHFFLTYFTFVICHMLSDNATLERSFFV